jgi:hypothetical protein
MKFHTTASNYLNSFPSASLRPVETAGSEAWEEDYCILSRSRIRIYGLTRVQGLGPNFQNYRVGGLARA